MPGGADTSDADGYGVRMRPQIGNQFFQAVRRQALLADDQQRLSRELRDRFEVHQQIERERVETADQGMRGQGADPQGVANTGRARGPGGAGSARRRRDIVNEDIDDTYRALEEAVDRLLQGYKRDDIDEARKALTEAAASLRGAL